ncbi:hypothetical protein MSHI_12680 [Mycobacterium shinjukuense]|uniref:Uncharacterized protein n=1 Tax=Mycobacterium shinjukuense TaxID=398694 RepID=A0A7I7MNF1_9MYCO|nr:hypothetical protein MSHI_12680 [Mycobacterium shinjukuense]
MVGPAAVALPTLSAAPIDWRLLAAADSNSGYAVTNDIGVSFGDTRVQVEHVDVFACPRPYERGVHGGNKPDPATRS